MQWALLLAWWPTASKAQGACSVGLWPGATLRVEERGSGLENSQKDLFCLSAAAPVSRSPSHSSWAAVMYL